MIVEDQAEEQTEVAEEQAEAPGDAEGGDSPAAGEAQEQLVVSIGGEAAESEGSTEEPAKAPGWVKDLRKKNREQERELRDLRRKLNESGVIKEPELGPKPTLESFDYDQTKYEEAYASWLERKRKEDERKKAADEEAKTAEQRWKAKLEAFQQAKAVLEVEDFEEAEALVTDLLDVTQQGIIVHGAKDSALVIYAIGKNEGVAKKLAAIKDPVEFAFAVARLEAQMKVTGKRPAVAPEERISGSGRPSGAIDSTLAKLRADAEKTGDYSKVHRYKKEHPQK
jgi:hypothetical protein